MIQEQAPHIHFHFEVRHEFLDREMAQLFAGITCSLQIGLQSADPQVLKGVNRLFNRDDFIRKVRLLNESGAIFGFDLIYGLPGDSPGGFRESLDFALELYPNHLDIFPLAVLPGTPLAERSEAIGLQRLNDPPYTLIATPTFSADELRQAGELAAACDIFYSRGKAVAWFNSVCAVARLSASVFLEQFSVFLTQRFDTVPHESALADEEVWQLQRDFLSQIFAGGKSKRLLPLALDLVDYNYHYAAALMAVPPEVPTDGELATLPLLNLPWRCAASARLATFSYEIFDILEAGSPDLKEFATLFTATGSCAVIYPRAGEVFTESLIKPFYDLLQRLDGKTPARKIVIGLRIEQDEAVSFLEFAAAEGIIEVPSNP